MKKNSNSLLEVHDVYERCAFTGLNGIYDLSWRIDTTNNIPILEQWLDLINYSISEHGLDWTAGISIWSVELNLRQLVKFSKFICGMGFQISIVGLSGNKENKETDGVHFQVQGETERSTKLTNRQIQLKFEIKIFQVSISTFPAW